MKFFQNYSDSKWIGQCPGDWCPMGPNNRKPAPYLRHEFVLDRVENTKLALCGLGYFVAYINGRRVGDHVLDPITTAYDKTTLYVVFDVTKLLKKGRNAIGVVLGNGWHNTGSGNPWALDWACWQDDPKMRLEMRSGTGKLVLGSDETWKVTRQGPVRFDALREGVCYDARLDLGKWSEPNYDDSAWVNTFLIPGPGGLMKEQTAAPIRITDTQVLSNPNHKGVYDLQRNIAGIARITVHGEPGAKVKLFFTERKTEDGDISRKNQIFVWPGLIDNTHWQNDEYILKGDPKGESWEPEFTYHGFQYVKVVTEGDVTVDKVEARILHSDFAEAGNFAAGHPMVNTLQTLTRRSYLANFVGIPTDCPHREKNGWTGDAQLASETGLLNFDVKESYKQWIGTMRDCQLPNGALPGIVPTSGWGYRGWSGPAWDGALFVIPWNIYIYTGDKTALLDSYDAMKRYIDYVKSQSIDHIVCFGLGDWCPEPAKMVDARLTSTAIFYGLLQIAEKTALLKKLANEAKSIGLLAQKVAKAFHREFYRGDGVYANGEWTAMGAALYYGLCPTPLIQRQTVDCLAKMVEAEGAKALFGILGAKFVPRVLADNGHHELAAKFFTQEEFPGWAHWVVADKATSLHEVWGTGASWNHIMFGDLSAWCFTYPGGFRYDEKFAKYGVLTIQPLVIPEWKSFKAEHGGYVTEWKVLKSGKVSYTVTIPEDGRAVIKLPGAGNEVYTAGTYRFS